MPWGSLCTEAHSGPGKEAGPLWLLLKWRCIFHIYVLAFYQVYILKSQIEYRVHFNFRECRKWVKATCRSLWPAQDCSSRCAAPTFYSCIQEQLQASGSSPGHMSLGACSFPLLPATCVTPWSDEPLLLHCSTVPATVHVSHMRKTLSHLPLCLLAKDWLYVADTW